MLNYFIIDRNTGYELEIKTVSEKDPHTWEGDPFNDKIVLKINDVVIETHTITKEDEEKRFYIK